MLLHWFVVVGCFCFSFFAARHILEGGEKLVFSNVYFFIVHSVALASEEKKVITHFCPV